MKPVDYLAVPAAVLLGLCYGGILLLACACLILRGGLSVARHAVRIG